MRVKTIWNGRGGWRRTAGAACAVATLGLAACNDAYRAPVAYTQENPGVRMARASELFEAGRRAEQEGKLDEAAARYREAVEAYDDSAAAWLNLGTVLLKQNKAMEASEALRTAADLWPQDPRPVYNLGVMWEQRGYTEDASRWYDQALERDENYLPALRRAIYLDQVRVRADEKTDRRLRRALLLESDPRWREYFERQQLRVQAAAKAGVLSLERPGR